MARLPYVVVFFSAQGGSGKTTVCANVAEALSQMGKRILIVDSDKDVLGLYNIKPKTLLSLKNIVASDFVRKNKFLKIYRIACRHDLFIEHLFHYLEQTRRSVDYIFVDLNVEPFTPIKSVLASAHRVIVPYTLSGDPQHVLHLTFNYLTQAKQKGNSGMDIDIVANRIDRRGTFDLKLLDQLKDVYGPLVFPFYIAETVREREASLLYQTLVESFPAEENVRVYRKLAAKLFYCTPPSHSRSIISTKNGRTVLLG